MSISSFVNVLIAIRLCFKSVRINHLFSSCYFFDCATVASEYSL